MHWDRLFEDLEGQLAAEWEAEKAALDAESERLRISKLTLLQRLRLMQRSDAPFAVRLADGERQTGRLRAVGADWIAIQTQDAPAALIVPIAAVAGVETHHGAILETLEDVEIPNDGMRSRMTMGFLLRDFARRRLAVRLALTDGERLHGTIDRAGDDHLDLAMHDPGEPRLSTVVRGFRIVPFTAVQWVRTASGAI
ncbi:hypothetical protein [Microbacterium sp. Bi121]|uniref:hypothetical protein n=1 Tax=Microbacterium sp. Bi121 TaxID=2822348 RepID=UPI001D34199E|nr:hypothetical protein [Microbacterium sp. Bi121]CAH0135328.1 hypothetical protein SRABI121_00878 [Microbacterium sp. Bi121]